MKTVLMQVVPAGGHRLHVAYSDGLSATLDFSDYLAHRSGPLVEQLHAVSFFISACIDHGVLTWPNGYDICPDVLRFWCERGVVCSQEETDAHFESLRPSNAS
ncbi:MAG: DUF2442 domain-containing protein [Planctomycetota bacterium]